MLVALAEHFTLDSSSLSPTAHFFGISLPSFSTWCLAVHAHFYAPTAYAFVTLKPSSGIHALPHECGPWSLSPPSPGPW